MSDAELTDFEPEAVAGHILGAFGRPSEVKEGDWPWGRICDDYLDADDTARKMLGLKGKIGSTRNLGADPVGVERKELKELDELRDSGVDLEGITESRAQAVKLGQELTTLGNLGGDQLAAENGKLLERKEEIAGTLEQLRPKIQKANHYEMLLSREAQLRDRIANAMSFQERCAVNALEQLIREQLVGLAAAGLVEYDLPIGPANQKIGGTFKLTRAGFDKLVEAKLAP